VRSIERYVHNHGIRVEILSGPNWEVDDEGWEHHAYQLKLINPDRGTEMTVPWTAGVGITRTPDERPEEVFDTLVSDAWGFVSADDFGDWAGEYGFDVYSIKAANIWRAIGEQAEAFQHFIGGSAELERLALEYERL